MNASLWKDGVLFLIRLARDANMEGHKRVALELLKSAILAEGMA